MKDARFEELTDLCFRLLYGCDLIYARSPRPREDLLRAAEIFAGDIYELATDPAMVEEAFREHRKSSPYYPRPSDINALLRGLRERRGSGREPEPRDNGGATRGMPEACLKALRGDREARDFLRKIMEIWKLKEGRR